MVEESSVKPEEHCDASSGLNRLRENTKCLWAGQEIRTVCSNPRLWAKTVNRKKRLLEGAELKVLSLCKLAIKRWPHEVLQLLSCWQPVARCLEAGNRLPENIPGSSCLGNSLTLLLPGCMSVSCVLRSHWFACKLSPVYFGSHPPHVTSCYFVESHWLYDLWSPCRFQHVRSFIFITYYVILLPSNHLPVG